MGNCKASFVECLRSGCLDLVFANQQEAEALAVVMGLAPAEGGCRPWLLSLAELWALRLREVGAIAGCRALQGIGPCACGRWVLSLAAAPCRALGLASAGGGCCPSGDCLQP